MSKEAGEYFIEDWGDKTPNHIILRYEETELMITIKDLGRTMQAYADEVKVEFANYVMNKAYGKNGIKGIPHSNKISEFISTLKNLNK